MEDWLPCAVGVELGLPSQPELPTSTPARTTTRIGYLTLNLKLITIPGYYLWFALVAFYQASSTDFLALIVALGVIWEGSPVTTPYDHYQSVVRIITVKVQESRFAVATGGVSGVDYGPT